MSFRVDSESGVRMAKTEFLKISKKYLTTSTQNLSEKVVWAIMQFLKKWNHPNAETVKLMLEFEGIDTIDINKRDDEGFNTGLRCQTWSWF